MRKCGVRHRMQARVSRHASRARFLAGSRFFVRHRKNPFEISRLPPKVDGCHPDPSGYTCWPGPVQLIHRKPIPAVRGLSGRVSGRTTRRQKCPIVQRQAACPRVARWRNTSPPAATHHSFQDRIGRKLPWGHCHDQARHGCCAACRMLLKLEQRHLTISLFPRLRRPAAKRRLANDSQ